MYLIDTDICIQFMRNEKKVVENISKLDDKYISIITLSELFYGIFNSKAKKRHLTTLERFLSHVTVLDTDFSIAFLFGKIKSQLKNKGRFSGDFDMINAAFVKAFDLTLITMNVKHYDKIEGIRILDL